jgi:hypothetical protein
MIVINSHRGGGDRRFQLGARCAKERRERMLTSFILMLIKLLSSPVLVAALAKFLANALKTLG